VVRDSDVWTTGHLYTFSRSVSRAKEWSRRRACSWVTTVVTEGKARPRRDGWRRAANAQRRQQRRSAEDDIMTTTSTAAQTKNTERAKAAIYLRLRLAGLLLDENLRVSADHIVAILILCAVFVLARRLGRFRAKKSRTAGP